MKIYATPLWFLLAIVCFGMWQRTGDIWWTLAASAFALASIRSSILLIKEILRQ